MKNKKLITTALTIIATTFIASCNGTNKKNDQLCYAHSWTAEGLGGHFFSGADMGPVSWYVAEGLGDYLRTQDEVYYSTAKSIEHSSDHTSIVKLREDVKWHYTNEPLKAMDIVSYYYLNTSTVSNYLRKIEAVDDYTVKFTWNEHFEPVDQVKTLLLVTDRSVTVPYSVFKNYVDICKGIYDSSPEKDYNQDKTMSPFNRVLKDEDGITLSGTYSSYQDYTPTYFPATGPYKIKAYDANEMILEKNQDWYNADKVGFKTIKLINSIGDASLFANMIINGSIDLWLNTPSKPTIDNILKQNENIAFYKVLSPYTHGVKFNMNKTSTLWTNTVREAFQYIFDRNEVRKLACYYANTSWTPMNGMTDTDLDTWLSDGAKKQIETKFTYDFDLNKATELLKSAGWSRKSGKWYDQRGKLVEIIIGYDGSNTVPSSIAEQVQAQLSAFGIQASLKRAAGYGEFYAMATSESCPYDLVCDNTSYNASYNYPSACFNEVYKSGVGATAGIKQFIDKEQVGYNAHVFKPTDYLDYMLTYTGDELTTAVDDLVIGACNLNYGINMFQEASGGIYNMKKIAGLPYMDKVQENRDVQYIPTGGTKDHIDMLYAILFYDHGSALYNGRLYPAGE